MLNQVLTLRVDSQGENSDLSLDLKLCGWDLKGTGSSVIKG